MIYVIDNYDSFVYNLVQYLGRLGYDCVTRRNDAVTVEEVAAAQPSLVLLSPGPGRPADAGVCADLVRLLAGRIPILGVCLGHQVIAEVFGAVVTHARRPMHGKRSAVFHDGRGVFDRIPAPVSVIRYHSLAVDPLSLPDCLIVTAVADDGEVMAIRHRELPVHGVQFHPESAFTDHGLDMMANAVRELTTAARRPEEALTR